MPLSRVEPRNPSLVKSPITADRANYADTVREAICAVAATACRHAYGRRLRALVLTGSLARDEATIVPTATGCILMGDVDFLLVLDNGQEPAGSELHCVASAVGAQLSQRGIDVHVSIGAVRTSYFRTLPPHSFTYELRACGRTIWGDRGILQLIPKYAPNQLSKEDAWRTLNNRIIELLACYEEVPIPSRPPSSTLRYAAIKLYLDSTASYLIFVEQYEPTYAGRARRLSALLKQPTVADKIFASPAHFCDRVCEATDWKISGAYAEANAWGFIHDAIRYAHQLWRWEAMRLSCSNGGLSIRALVEAVAKNQSIAERIRGWLALLKRVGWSKSGRNWMRWLKLSWQGTPRYLVYRVAAEALFSPEPRDTSPLWPYLSTQLPVQTGNVRSWAELVAATVLNYERFLLNTRA